MEDIQGFFFDQVKSKIPKGQSTAHVIADLLNISLDRSYRRLRGDVPLRLDEALKLSEEFGISLDELQGHAVPEVYIFKKAGLGETNLDFKSYLKNLLMLLNHIKSRGIEKVIFACKDIPVFHLFEFPKLSLFKIFFWQNTIFNSPDLKGQKFSVEHSDDYLKECLSLCRQIAEKYSMIPTIEIWNEETSFSFMKQVQYYYEAGLFKEKSDAEAVVREIEEYFAHLQEEASRGYKFIHDKPPRERLENFTLYYNDLILIDNVIHIRYEEGKEQSFLVYHSIEYLNTEDQEFSRAIKSWLKNLSYKSDLISTVSEKNRYKFFKKVEDRQRIIKKNIGMEVDGD